MPLFFFRELRLITVLLLICDSYISWSARFVCLKLRMGFFIFDSVSFLLKFIYIFSNKMQDSLTLKRYNSFQNWNNRKATHSFASRPLTFKLQQEVLKFNDIFVSWSSPKLTWWTDFLNLEYRSFENLSFSQ